MFLSIVWDEKKNQDNIKKHGISFQEASPVFDDPHLMEFYDEKHSTAREDRYIIFGMIQGNIVLYTVYTEQKGQIRLIMARKAQPQEEALYDKHLKETFG
jgi:uncharacterized DUF497 family protein